jgi:hypothetical protein
VARSTAAYAVSGAAMSFDEELQDRNPRIIEETLGLK